MYKLPRMYSVTLNLLATAKICLGETLDDSLPAKMDCV